MTRLAIGVFPTPLERLDRVERGEGLARSSQLWVKRDDLSSDVYGGNKIRKLEVLFGAAREANKTRVLTIGAAGSHQVVATAIFGRMNGFEAEAILVPQPASEHAKTNLRVALAHGLVATPAPTWSLAPVYVAARRGHDAYWIPLGGSNALGSLGFLEAGRELAAQARAGQMPEPDVCVVALGSGGTTAGLAVAFEEAEMKTRVLGVAVSRPVAMLAVIARRLAKQTAALAGLSKAVGAGAARRIAVSGEFLGRGYAHPTREGQAAIESARAAGLVLDSTYTAKAFAAALSLARASSAAEGAEGAANGEPRVVLYWHTLSTAKLAADPDALARDLPPKLDALFRG